MSRYQLRSNGETSNNNNNKNNTEREICPLFELINDPQYIPTLKDMFLLIRETHRTVSFLADKFDDINTKIQQVTQQNKEIVRENQEIQERLSYVETYFFQQQQQQLNAHLTFHGITYKANENIENIIIDTVKALNTQITNNDIKNIRRMNTTTKKPNIAPIVVVEFNTSITKQNIQHKYKENGPIMVKQVFPSTSNETGKIYINEYLTNQTKNLYTEAKQLKNKCNFQYVWVKNGRIFAREKPGSDVIKIFNQNNIRGIIDQFNQTKK